MKQGALYCLLLLFTSCAYKIAAIPQFAGTKDPCGPNKALVIQATKSGFIYSPGYEKGQNYSHSLECSYQIQAPRGMHVLLEFHEVDIELTDGCSADSLGIYDFMADGQGVPKAIYCGRQTPRNFVSKTFAVQLVFVSNEFISGRGFNISYHPKSSENVCQKGELQCHNRNCVKSSVSCDGTDNCGDGTDEENCGFPLLQPECGKPDIDPATSFTPDRVIGGEEAVKGSWPWMVSMQIKLLHPSGHICGGTLINAEWVLTAAHCFADYRSADQWRFHFGSHSKFVKETHEQIRYAKKVIIYDDIPAEEFIETGEFDMENDIALVKLNAPVIFTKYVKPACLPDMGHELSFMEFCYATGWGVTRGTGHTDVLKQAQHPIQIDSLCKRLVGDEFSSKTMICAGSMAPGNAVCHGDSGGPLVCQHKKKWNVMGVASYVTDTNFIDGLCGFKGRPSVFTKVSAKIYWIKKIINRYS